MKRAFWRSGRIAITAACALTLPWIAAARAQIIAGQQNGTVTGRILLQDGTPVAGTRVGAITVSASPAKVPPQAQRGQQAQNAGQRGQTRRATEDDTLLESMAQTDREGRYRIENIRPGQYYLVVGQLDDPIYFPGMSPRSNALVVTVTAGATLPDRDFLLHGPLTMKVSGRVVRADHRAGTRVILTGANAELAAAIAPDGSFEFPRVPAGVYRAMVSPNIQVSATVNVRDADVNGFVIVVPRSAVTGVPITFKITVENGGPLPRFSLDFVPTAIPFADPPEKGRSVPAKTVGSPQQLALSEYHVALPTKYGLPDGYFIKAMTAGPTDLLKQPLKLDGEAVIAITLGVSSPPPWVRVMGKITGFDQPSLKPDTLVLTSSSFVFPFVSSIQADGSFEFPIVPPGTYQAGFTSNVDRSPSAVTVGQTDILDLEIPMAFQGGRVNEIDPAPDTAIRPLK